MNDAADIGDREALRRWLQWQLEMGVDEAIADAPQDRTAISPKPAPAAPRPAAPAAPTAGASTTAAAAPGATPAAAPAATPIAAPAAADGPSPQECHSLEEIHRALDALRHFPLRRMATHTVFTDGNAAARIMLIGEAPGADEDRIGRPFVGRAGQLLDRMLAAIGLARDNEGPWDSVLITNVLFWRPPGNRNPTEAELAFCRPWLERTIEIVKPAVIVCLGGVPTQRLTGSPAGILRQRGKWQQLKVAGLPEPVPLLPTLHPAYLLRQPLQKRLAWRDWLILRCFIDERRG